MKINFPEYITGKCTKCLQRFSYPSVDFEQDSEDFDRYTSVETEHSFSMVKKCSVCGHQHIIAMSAFEFPQGFFNLVHPSIHGVTLDSRCSDFFGDD